MKLQCHCKNLEPRYGRGGPVRESIVRDSSGGRQL